MLSVVVATFGKYTVHLCNETEGQAGDGDLMSGIDPRVIYVSSKQQPRM